MSGISVDWGSIAFVFVATLVAAVAIVAIYSLGLRLLAIGSADDAPGVSSQRSARPPAATIGGFACIGIGAAAVLYGIYLVIPQFH